MKVLHIVADYGPGDLAFSEMVTALGAFMPDGYLLWATPVGSFDTIGTGFCVAQLGLQDRARLPKDLIIYANCAPRKDLTEARLNNQGEKLVFGRLKNGVPVVIVSSGYSLSFIKHDLAELWSVSVSREGSQFRSRDVFPPVVGQVAKGDFDFLRDPLDPLDPEVIPDYPVGVVAYRDSFGNLKTTFRTGDKQLEKLQPGQQIDVTINGVTRPVFVATENFNVREGSTAFAPGSSGFERRFWEIFLRGGSAYEDFLHPQPGTEVTLSIPE